MYSLELLLLLPLWWSRDLAPLLTPAGTVDTDAEGVGGTVESDVALLAVVAGLLGLVVGLAGKKI